MDCPFVSSFPFTAENGTSSSVLFVHNNACEKHDTDTTPVE